MLYHADASAWLRRAAALALICSFAFFCKVYYHDFPRYNTTPWRYGMREAIERAAASPHPVIFSHQLVAPHIFLLFYTGYPPEKYHALPTATKAGATPK